MLVELLGGPDRVISKRSPALLGRFALSETADKGAIIISDCPPLPSLRSLAAGEYLEGLATIKAISGGDAVDLERQFGPQRLMRLDLLAGIELRAGLGQRRRRH